MSGTWLVVAGVGAIALVASTRSARAKEIPGWEVRVFRATNGLPAWLFPLLWPVMQLGNLVVGTVAGLVVAWVAGDPVVALGVVLALILKLATEHLLRGALDGELPARTRPGTSQPCAVLRGADVPVTGPSFPSGHVVLAAAVACVVAPVFPDPWWFVPILLTLVVMFGRVFVGAHNPLDVTGGLGAGLILGGIVASFVGQ